MSMNLKRVLRALLVVMAVAGAGAPPAAAQDGALAARCAALEGDARTVCLAAAQAAESAQPQLGILIAGGNPVIGTTGGGGLRLGVVPRVDVSGGVNLVFVRLPDLLQDGGGTVQRVTERYGVPAPALGASGSMGLFRGFGIAPGLGGLGSLDLLGSATWLPFRALGIDGFDEETPDIAWGAGVRVGVLRESFIAPGVAVSVMRHSLGRVGFGDVCRGFETAFPMSDEAECVGEGDHGEFGFDLVNWSTRGVVGKRLLGLGLLGGIGYDRYTSDATVAFRYPDVVPGTARIVRPDPVDLRSDRWSVFANASYTLLLASLSVEAGWQQGDRPVPGFGGEARFDPRGGSWFGGAGVRLSF
jgi:hypothetical protein